MCNLGCSFCYVNASKSGRNFDNICEKAKFFFGQMSENEKPFQIAIGSSGCPLIHSEFCDFLETIYKSKSFLHNLIFSSSSLPPVCFATEVA